MENKKNNSLYSLGEALRFIYRAGKSIRHIVMKNKSINPKFKERIMLIVTKVNQCPGCNFYHSKIALENGFTKEELTKLVNMDINSNEDIPENELYALMFAEHVAYTRGKPSLKLYKTFSNKYSKKEMLAIMANINMIMLGNTYGIPIGSFQSRFKNKPDSRSSIYYEIKMLLSLLFLFPLFLLSGILVSFFSLKLISFQNE